MMHDDDTRKPRHRRKKKHGQPYRSNTVPQQQQQQHPTTSITDDVKRTEWNDLVVREPSPQWDLSNCTDEEANLLLEDSTTNTSMLDASDREVGEQTVLDAFNHQIAANIRLREQAEQAILAKQMATKRADALQQQLLAEQQRHARQLCQKDVAIQSLYSCLTSIHSVTQQAVGSSVPSSPRPIIRREIIAPGRPAPAHSPHSPLVLGASAPPRRVQ
jgi:hypothetical protein